MQRYLCVGGPNSGMYLEEHYAPDGYFRFNSASGELLQRIIVKKNGDQYFVKKRKGVIPRIWVPKCILIWCEQPEDLIIDLDKK